MNYPRYIRDRLVEALADTPIVVVHGPRQSGKTTLVRQVGDIKGYAYLSFDDDAILSAAKADPIGFVSQLPNKVVIDEVQRLPELFTTLKAVIDRDRKPGRFILTGSANVLLLPHLADSLAGRMEVLRLHPLSQSEIVAVRPTFLQQLFKGTFFIEQSERLGNSLAERIVAGGYPAALARRESHRKAAWYRDYLAALLQRDVRDLARVSSLQTLPRLLTMAAGQTARLINITDMAGPFQLSRPTIREYVTLLERLFLLEELPPWHSNRLSRLIKTPKLHLSDTGVACVAVGLNTEALIANRGMFGQMLETFIYQELRRQASWQIEQIAFYHFRDKDGAEVDIVAEQNGGSITGIEVKAAATITTADFRGLRKLREAAGKQFTSGVVLYDGETLLPFGENLYAVPIRKLWESG